MEEIKVRGKQKILIVDDSEMNREILSEILCEDYELQEAANGVRALEILGEYGGDVDLMLLDITMPEMDGFEVLSYMNRSGLIENIPVIMISAENATSYVERAYEMGVTDYIQRPFDVRVVRRRVVNTLMLYARQERLADMVIDLVYEREKDNYMMLNILSHIVEFRNGESGLHVVHIQKATEILLENLVKKTDKYKLSQADITRISKASSLHDIGKISIADEILNKPGRLTQEEFEIIKGHSMAGANLLGQLPVYTDDPLVKTAYEICRWHHERYDGRGYPDGLVGDQIPISAQIVALADVYDALTSERCYKKAFSHEKAVEMINNGECGTFNPLVLECLTDVSDSLQAALAADSPNMTNDRQIRGVLGEILGKEDMGTSGRILRLMEEEREKTNFFTSRVKELQFDYNVLASRVTISQWGADYLGLNKVILNSDTEWKDILGEENLKALTNKLHQATPENPEIEMECLIDVQGELRWHLCEARALWSKETHPQYIGAVGKLTESQPQH